MSDKIENHFTQEQINELTNKIFITYFKWFQQDKMSFSEITLVENVITRIQIGLDEIESD